MGRLLAFGVTLAALLAFVGQRIVEFRRRALWDGEVQQNHLPNCQLIKGLEYGSEDITILPNGLAIISTGLKYLEVPHFSDAPGKIFVLDLEDENLKPVELRIGRGFDVDSFNPHGISIYIDEKDQSVYLFVVNHPEGKSQVEIFQFFEEENSIIHLKTIQHDLLYSVNDIVAVGVESFYATNDHFFTNALLRHLELLIMQPWTNVIYYSPEEVKVVAEKFYFANGINISPDKRYIYVADIMNHTVEVFEMQENRALHHVKAVPVELMLDNIEVDRDTGDLWIGCHTNGRKILRYNPEDPPGSEVIKIQNIHSERPIVTHVYADNGSVIQGSSVAAYYNDRLLIGSVFHKALYCDLK